MTLKNILNTMKPNKYINVYWKDGEITFKKVYEIEWHNKELLDKEVENLWAEEDKVCVYIKK